MKIKNSIAVVTGANRGIGHAFVEELLKAGAQKVYATARDTSKLADLVKLGDGKVVPLALNVHDDASVANAAEQANDATLLINNAGTAAYATHLTGDIAAIHADFNTNYFGTLRVIRAFEPYLKEGSAIVNIASVVSFANMPALGGYSASKAALHSLTLGVRGELTKRGISVHGVYPGPVDTAMAEGIDMPKTSPNEVAAAVLAGVENGDNYILPDPMAAQVYAGWSQDHQAVEAQFGSM